MRLERSQLSGESEEDNEWWQIKRRLPGDSEKAEGSPDELDTLSPPWKLSACYSNIKYSPTSKYCEC